MIDAVTWSLITEPGDSLAGYLRDTFGLASSLDLVRSNISAKELVEKLPPDHFRPEGFLNTLEDGLECWRRRLTDADPKRALEQIHSLGGKFITSESESWPEQINDLHYSTPVGLWLIGNLQTAQDRISVVGSRIASDYGLAMTQSLVSFSTTQDWIVVSGGALGIDAQASRTAMDSGGSTWVVMAGGLDHLYPKHNLELFEEVASRGAIISEMPPAVRPSRWRFLQRNRLIAALGNATLVVEAGFRSGSINTAGHANELNRPVGAIPGRVDSVRSQGCHRLIRERRAELIATPGQLLELMGFSAEDEVIAKPQNSYELRVLDALGRGICPVSVVAKLSGMTLVDAGNTLERLARANLVRRISEGWQKL